MISPQTHGMSRGYGQYCPLSLASELLCRRWTVLVVSRILMGCSRFNEIHRGVPQMSPSLLTRRLEELERAGIIETRPIEGSKWREYLPTAAGEDLAPVVQEMALWGHKWARDMELEDLDPAFLVWSMHTRIDREALPQTRIVIKFSFSEAPADCEEFWLVCEDGDVDMCLKDPGHDVDLVVVADLRVFIEAWRGFRDLRTEMKAGRIRVTGPVRLRERFPDWLRLHVLAGAPRLRSGRERRLARSSRSG